MNASGTPESSVALKVPDMSCGHCVKAITEAVQGGIPGTTVSADTSTKRVTVSGTADRARVEALITAAGYTPEAAA